MRLQSRRTRTCSLAFHSASEASKRPSGSSPPKGLYCSRAVSSCSAAFRTIDDLSSSRPAVTHDHSHIYRDHQQHASDTRTNILFQATVSWLRFSTGMPRLLAEELETGLGMPVLNLRHVRGNSSAIDSIRDLSKALQQLADSGHIKKVVPGVGDPWKCVSWRLTHSTLCDAEPLAHGDCRGLFQGAWRPECQQPAHYAVQSRIKV